MIGPIALAVLVVTVLIGGMVGPGIVYAELLYRRETADNHHEREDR